MPPPTCPTLLQEKQVTQQVTHCIFDMDGLLINTEGFYTDVQECILERFNRKFTFELKSQMMGRKVRLHTLALPPSPAASTPSRACTLSQAPLDCRSFSPPAPCTQALEAAEILVTELKLEGLLTPEDFVAEREAALDALFPTSQLLPGAGAWGGGDLGWCCEWMPWPSSGLGICLG